MTKKQPKTKNNNRKNQKSTPVTKYTGFFAFPNKPDDRKKIIEESITLVNQKEKATNFKITSWSHMDKTSSRIITNILESIRNSDLLVADLSGLNYNVLFEVGFAFGLGKKLLLFIQGFSKKERDEDLSSLPIINGLEILQYQNKGELSDTIIGNINEIINKREPEINKFRLNTEIKQENKGLFLKGATKHEYVNQSLSAFKGIYNNCTVDDWNEDISQTLHFYINEVEKAIGVAAILIPENWDESKKVNARFSFICGMALARNRHVLMIGMPGFISPLDYKDILLMTKESVNIAEAISKAFSEEPTISQLCPLPAQAQETNDIQEVESEIIAPIETVTLVPSKSHEITNKDKELILIDINIGNPVAENEEHELIEYFVETGQYAKAIKSKQALIVGSKGSGKTACFYQIRDYYKRDSTKNLICEIKPTDYKMERFLNSLKSLENEKGFVGHVLENVWKLVVYCCMLEELYNEFNNRPAYITLTDEENKLYEFVISHSDIIITPFEQKLEKANDMLLEVSLNIDSFSKKIHDEFLSKAKVVLQPVLKTRKKVVILLDNLDKAWMTDNNLRLQAQLFFNFLGIHRRLNNDFGIVDVSILVFIRRNIFEYIIENIAREEDKLSAETIELTWHDKELLLRVIEERFNITTSNWVDDVEDVWTTFFKWENKEISLKDWLYKAVLPRPRDLIRLIQNSIESAINNQHSEIYEEDLIKASRIYSGFALDQIIAEYKAEEPWIKETMNSFIGDFSTYGFNELVTKIKANSNDSLVYTDIIHRIETLVKICFMGIKNNGASIIYSYDLQDDSKLTSIIKNKNLIKNCKFIIHPVFYKHLDIIDGEKEITLFNLVTAFLKNYFR